MGTTSYSLRQYHLLCLSSTRPRRLQAAFERAYAPLPSPPLPSPPLPLSLPLSLIQELARLEEELGGMRSAGSVAGPAGGDRAGCGGEPPPGFMDAVPLPLMMARVPFRRPSDMFGLPTYTTASTSGQRAGAASPPEEPPGIATLTTLLFSSLPVRD